MEDMIYELFFMLVLLMFGFLIGTVLTHSRISERNNKLFNENEKLWRINKDYYFRNLLMEQIIFSYFNNKKMSTDEIDQCMKMIIDAQFELTNIVKDVILDAKESKDVSSEY